MGSIKAIDRYACQGKSAFEEQELIQVWVVHHLQIIGEATTALPDSLTSLYQQISWAQIVDLRKNVVHDYYRETLNLVWSIVVNDLPILKTQTSQVLADVTEGGER